MEMSDLVLVDGVASARTHGLTVYDSLEHWFDLAPSASERPDPLGALDCVMMRKDPPFDMEYVFATYMLERAQAGGTLVVNDPRSIRDASEKLFTRGSPICVPRPWSRAATAICATSWPSRAILW